MLNKKVTIYCNEKDKFTIETIVGHYSDRKGMIIDERGTTVSISLLCSRFKIKNLKHDIKILNNVGIEVEIQSYK